MRKIFVSLIFLVLPFCVKGQHSDTLAMRLEQQLLSLPHEKVYLQTDKKAYLSGERIWLRAHLVNASDGRPSRISRYVYIELLSPASDVSARIMLRPDSLGVFAGHLDLKEDLPEGIYTLRAYTRYMQNQGEEYFFRKTVQVLDPYSLQVEAEPVFSVLERGISLRLSFKDRRTGEPVEPEIVTIRLPGKAESSLKNRSGFYSSRLDAEAAGQVLLLGIQSGGRKYQKYFSIPVAAGEFDVSLLPEGGYLIPGRACRVGVKVLGADGLGKDVTGIVEDSKGNQVAAFGSLYKGMGYFVMKALAGESYTAVCTATDGSVKRFPLPAANAGASIIQLQSIRGLLNVALIEGPESSRNGLTLLVHQCGRPLYCNEWDPENNYISFRAADLPSGIIGFLLLDGDSNILSERLYFNLRPEDIVDPEGFAGKNVYGTRQHVRAEFHLPPGVESNVGISVIDSGTALADTTDNLLSSLLLSSELRGYLESPADYFTPAGQPHLDALMLTQCWRRYDIPSVLKGQMAEARVKAEKFQSLTGHAEGFVFNTMDGGRVSLFAVHEDKTSVDYAPLSKDGHFSFATEFPEGTQITVQTQTRKGKKGNIIEIDDVSFPSAQNASIKTLTPSAKPDDYMEQADEAYLREHGIRATMLEAAVVSADSEEKTSSSIWYSQVNSSTPLTAAEIERAHYTSITSVFLNTPGLVIRRNSEGYYLTTTRSEQPVLPVIDDVVLPEYDPMTLSVTDIDNLFVIKDNSAVFGLYAGYNGALVIKTTSGNAGATVSKSLNISRVKPLGYQTPVEFWSPKYETAAERDSSTPDLRTTIYWNPSVMFDKSGNAVVDFWSADKESGYLLTGEGVAADGRIISFKRTITIE